MAQLRNAIRAFSVERLKPSSVLARLNRLAEDALDTLVRNPRLHRPGSGDERLPALVRRSSASRRGVSRRAGRVAGGRSRAPARNRDRREVPSGDDRASGRHGPRPLHRRARRAARSFDRRRPRRPPGCRCERTEESGSASRAHPRASVVGDRRARRRHRAPRGTRPSGAPRAFWTCVFRRTSTRWISSATRCGRGSAAFPWSAVRPKTWCSPPGRPARTRSSTRSIRRTTTSPSAPRPRTRSSESWSRTRGAGDRRRAGGPWARTTSHRVTRVLGSTSRRAMRHPNHGREGFHRAHPRRLVALEQPDQQQDDDDEREDSTTDVHRALLSR